ncbi:MAG: hypothetical protein N2C12_14580, partial [Planctomycetales bacterium]
MNRSTRTTSVGKSDCTMSNNTMPESFWQTFVDDHWEQSPRQFSGCFQQPIVSAEELFDAILEKVNRVKSDRFWMANSDVLRLPGDYRMVPLNSFGPRQSDQSLAGFFSRAEKEFQDRQIGINVHHLQSVSAEIWFRFRKFVRSLIEITGELPTQRWDIDTFLGTY